MDLAGLASSIFSGPLPADIALGALALEAVVLIGLRGNLRAALVDIALVLGPGACLVLALRAALSGAPAWVVLVWLSASFPLHLADALRRGMLRREP